MSDNRKIIAGRYQLGNLIGRGGMADVYEGEDTRLGRVVAIKLLKSDLANDPSFEARFRQEAQASARMAHPTIVRIYDAGEEESLDLQGSTIRRPYIVMEYVKGAVLRDLLHQRRLTIEEAVDYTDGVLTALSVSHGAGIIHRDIKSANIMITEAGTVKVMDFGIARAVSDSANTQAYSVGIVGTAQYFSPEQARGENVDARTDLYSTGVLLYEMLAGRPPFKGETAVSVAYQHVSEAVTPPSVHNPMVSPELDAVVLQAMAKDRNERFQTADEFREHLAAAMIATQQNAAMHHTGSLPLVTDFEENISAGAATTVMPSAEAPVPVDASFGGSAEPTEVISDFDRLLRGDSPFDEPAVAANEAPATDAESATQPPVEYLYTGPVPTPVSGNPVAPTYAAPAAPANPELERADTSLITNPFSALGLDVPPVTTSSQAIDTNTGSTRVRRSATPSPRVLWGVGSGLGVIIVGLIVWFIAIGGNLPNLVINPNPTAGVSVPNVVGMTFTDGEKALTDAKLLDTKAYQQSDTVPVDTIISTDPPAGTKVGENQLVTVYVSSGKGQAQVPDLANLTEDAATTALTNAKLALGTINPVNSATVAQGKVVSSDPVAGTSVAAGSSINLNVSNGQVLVPNVVNLDVATAQKQLTAVDVQLMVSVQTATPCPGGGTGTTVLSQSILPGLAPQGSSIILTVGCN
ncbi:MAG: PASTA domain-containing protein [Actinomycetales bacterium]|nr:PASTA domain-containing protein [Actinomycetales bacterium]